MKKYLLFILIMLALITGCAEKEEASFTMTGNETLVRVEYYVSSQMVRGEDFAIDVTPEKINSALIFAERNSDYLTLEDTAISEAQWKEINDAVLAIAPHLKANEPDSAKPNNTLSGLKPLDGNNSSSFYLTWKTADGEVRVGYQAPSDRRYITLLDILRETADPVGREIVYYEAPVLTGLYFRRESLLPSRRYSYQCTLKNADTDERYLFAYYYKGEALSVSETVYPDTWSLITEKCAELGIEGLETVDKDSKILCTLYYSDDTQRRVTPDSQAQKELIALFEQIIAGLKEEAE